MNPILESHFRELQEKWPEAVLRSLDNGSFMVHIPAVELPFGWSHTHSSISFHVPVGYPVAKPDCFWTDLDLRLGGGAMPMNSSPQNPPPDGAQRLWFSWHTEKWNPNSDNLFTYVHVIQNRFKEPR